MMKLFLCFCLKGRISSIIASGVVNLFLANMGAFTSKVFFFTARKGSSKTLQID